VTAVAVVGHVEWVEFAPVSAVPVPGEIVHAQETWEQAAGGGAVAAVQLARLAGACRFFCALGDDERGDRAAVELGARKGLVVQAVRRPRPQRRAFTFLDEAGERTITVIGERLVPHGSDPLPWGDLARADGVYFTGGDVDALRAARSARLLVATPRALETLRAGGVALDVLVASATDAGELYAAGTLDPEPRWVVRTRGGHGGEWVSAEGACGAWHAAPIPGPVADAYGCGDSFAAGLTYGLAHTGDIDAALALAARCGAACLTGHGPYEGQIDG